MLLELNSVTKSFGGLAAVKNVDLRVAEGEIVGLIGPNGAGKTTLFNLIAGTILPDTGRVVYEGREITRLPPYTRCRLGIARTFQLVRPMPHLSLLDNVAIGSAYGRRPAPARGSANQAAFAVLDRLGFGDRLHRPASSLTLVDRKRLELARALATDPKLLLLDELLAGLNPSEVLSAMDLVRQVRESGVTVIMVEHLVKPLFGVSDRVVVLSAGEKICEGSPADVARDTRVVDAYLGASHATGPEAIQLA